MKPPAVTSARLRDRPRAEGPPVPQVIDWQAVGDPEAAVRFAAQALEAGRVVAFPTETGYALAASGLHPAAVGRLPGDLAVAVRGLPEARDWVPAMSRIGQRLARRFWPGPVALQFAADVEEGLAGRLPEQVRDRVTAEGRTRLRVPAHEVLLEVMRRFAGPVVLAEVAPAPREGGEAL